MVKKLSDFSWRYVLYLVYVKHCTPKYTLRIPVYCDYDAEDWRWPE